jgi:hypothetical protein
MKEFISRNHKPLFYISWLVLNLVQAGSTGLLDDEAYYWVYSRFIDWGYFDHPPMVALMIKAGYSVFANPFGLRLFTVLMSTATLMMIDTLLEKRNDKLFYAIAASMFVLQVGGIITVPDLPLMFFTGLYFMVYKRFIAQPGASIAALLGLVIALMLYSKYHGILIVFFTLLSNLRLLRMWQTWLAAIVAGLLFAPHILWQFSHGLPSVNYHLFERNATSYKFAFTSEYLLGQIALAGPLIGWLLLYAAFTRKPENQLEKTLKWTTIGVYATFFIATFKGRVEANWTVPAFIGLITLAHQQINGGRWERLVYKLLLPTLALILVVRIYLAMDIVPAPWLKKDEFHKTREWAQAIKDSAHGLDVVFLDSYQKPSQYWFWTGDTSFALNTIRYRRNNYNFWPLEQRYQGRRVFVVSDTGTEIHTIRSNAKSRHIYGMVVDSFYSHSSIQLSTDGRLMPEGKKVFQIFPRAGQTTGKAVLILFDANNKVKQILPANYMWNQSTGAMASADISGLSPGEYKARWGFETAIPNRPSINSVAFTLVVP